MSTRLEQLIPYESQSDGESGRMCGAAALSMVYRSLAGPRTGRGEPVPVGVTTAEIWPRISRPNRFGSVACLTHLMAKDALGLGYAAVAIQAERPLQALRTCLANGIRAILNHRVRPDGPAGHYTVLVGMDSESVTVHDPLDGPSRRIPFDQLLQLWQPRFPDSEIIGNVLIGIADHPPRLETCTACSARIPADQPCPQCKAPVPLAPTALVGCVAKRCVHRNGLRVCCPSCDYTFPLNAAGAGATEAGPASESLDLGPLYAELEKFQSYVRSLPELAGREDVKQQLAALEETTEQVRLEEREERMRFQVEQEKRSERVAELEKERERVRKAQEAATTPGAPLDGQALSAQILKDLGIDK